MRNISPPRFGDSLGHMILDRTISLSRQPNESRSLVSGRHRHLDTGETAAGEPLHRPVRPQPFDGDYNSTALPERTS